MKIVKLTDGNGDIVYKVKPTLFKIIECPGYFWRDGEIGFIGESFTLEEAKRFVNSCKVKKETVKIEDDSQFEDGFEN